jgi:hypothetical protein
VVFTSDHISTSERNGFSILLILFIVSAITATLVQGIKRVLHAQNSLGMTNGSEMVIAGAASTDGHQAIVTNVTVKTS